MEYSMGRGEAGWRKIQISPATKAVKRFPRENNKLSKGCRQSEIFRVKFFQRSPS